MLFWLGKSDTTLYPQNYYEEVSSRSAYLKPKNDELTWFFIGQTMDGRLGIQPNARVSRSEQSSS